jgi:hypothetical protein
MLAAGRADAGLGIDEIERLSRFADSITKGVSMGERISFEFNGTTTVRYIATPEI